MLRYFFDEHVVDAIAEQLRRRGVDVLTAHAAGMANQGIHDDAVLRYAADSGRVLVTQDRDFSDLAYKIQPHEGVIMLQRPLSIGECIEYLELTAQVVEPEEIRNRLVYCDW